MKNQWYQKLLDKLFKNELHVQALQSMLKMQAEHIRELQKDKESWLNLYNDLKNLYDNRPSEILDHTPLEDPEHWKPLREAAELPSEKRIRLEAKYREIAKEKKKKQAEMEA